MNWWKRYHLTNQNQDKTSSKEYGVVDLYSAKKKRKEISDDEVSWTINALLNTNTEQSEWSESNSITPSHE